MGTPFYHVSGDAQRALEQFSMAFTMALSQGPVESWAKELGFYREVAKVNIKSTFPVPVSAAGYKEFLGDVKYRSLFQKSISLLHKTWQDGVSELADVVEAPDFVGWMDEPARIAQAGMSLPNEIIASRIEANPVCFDGENYFDTDHPVNVFMASQGTFSNDVTGDGTDPTTANLALAKERFRSIKAANGKPMGLRMTHVLVPGAQEELWKDILETDQIIQASDGGAAFGSVNNRHKGTVKLVVSDELTDDDKWYPLALNKPGMFPWILEDQGTPEELRSDKSSELYKSQLKIGIAYVMRGNGELALPHCIQRWAGLPPAT